MPRVPIPPRAVERVHVSAERRFFAVLGLGVAALASYIAIAIFASKLDDGAEIVGTAAYRAAEWAGRVGSMAWAAVFAAAAGWLVGASLRRALGIPVTRKRLHRVLQGARVVIVAGILIRMLMWAGVGGHGARFLGIEMSPESALIHGLIVCALAGFELPALIRRGFRCLRARIPSLRARRASLSALPARGRVRVSGTVAAEGLAGNVAYRRAWHSSMERMELEGQPFQLVDGGHRVWIDLDPARAVVDVSAYRTGQRMEIRAGIRVEVVGELVETPDGAYRGGARRIHAGAGRLYVFGGSGQVNRRLVVAGLVELGAAAMMVSAPLMLLVYWLVARWHLG